MAVALIWRMSQSLGLLAVVPVVAAFFVVAILIASRNGRAVLLAFPTALGLGALSLAVASWVL